LARSPEAVGRTEIVEHVWSYGFDSDTNLVEVYINRLRQKIDQPHRLKLIHTVRGIGYRLAASESVPTSPSAPTRIHGTR
jgi:two-component system copper resistance phosphate regulon response regulator CusR